MSHTVVASLPWYRSLNRNQWNILLAANLGWLFDGFELYALFLTVGPAMRALLAAPQYPEIPAYTGTVIAIMLLGWGIGGIAGGLLADYIGRKRTMIYAILAYSITTGLTAVAFDWVSFAFLRFLVGYCHRLRVGDRLVNDRGALAGSRARSWCRAHAMRHLASATSSRH
jgi:MFS family permease